MHTILYITVYRGIDTNNHVNISACSERLTYTCVCKRSDKLLIQRRVVTTTNTLP